LREQLTRNRSEARFRQAAPDVVGKFTRASAGAKPKGLHMRIVYLAGAVILLALLFGRADHASAQGSEAARQACTPDAMRLCSDVIPDVARVTACMKAKSSQLSQACRFAMRGAPSRGRHHGHYRGHYHHHHLH
jgi:hypothetical protein